MSKAVTADPSETSVDAWSVCPNCGSGLANVQGIGACIDCSWTDA